MTREEFLKLYGDITVTFKSYYKYTFTYTADLEDGSVLSVDFGGNSDDIYKFDVDCGSRIRVIDLDPYAGSVCKDGNEISSFYNY